MVVADSADASYAVNNPGFDSRFDLQSAGALLMPSDLTVAANVFGEKAVNDQQLSSPMLQLEVEDMVLDNYRLEASEVASNGMVASFWNQKRDETGRGTRDRIVGYFNEDSEIILDPVLNGQALGKVGLNHAIRYISPDGDGDGTSWEQAANIADLDALIEQSAPGDEVWLAGDLGNYEADRAISLDSGGTWAAPVYVRGVASRVGGKDTPLFVGDRTPNWAPGQSHGDEVFRLLNGANHLHFSNIDFKNVGNGAFRLGGDLTDITLEEMEANNVRRFVENAVAGGATTASVSDLTIRDVDILGFSKSAIRLQYDTHDVLIEDVYGDAQGQDGDEFAMGVHLQGTVHNVVHRQVSMNNAIQTKAESEYWNADGFVSDYGTYDITYEDTYASGSTDSGYDVKSYNTLFIRAAAADNKRNFRVWNFATMIDVVSDEPFKRGGTGSTAHIHVLEHGDLTITGGTFSGDKSIENIVFDLDDQGSLQVNGGIITDNLYTLNTVEDGSFTLNNLIES
ncbi:MAG: hypothetical protein WA885_01320 [Phormidesmis sp.]